MKCPTCDRGNLQWVEHKGGFWACSIRSCRTYLSKKAYQEYKQTGQYQKKERSPRAYKPKEFPRGTSRSPLIEGTKEQQEIWEQFGRGRNIGVDAKAGVGKSTLLVQACNRISDDYFIIVLSFSKRDQRDLAGRLPPNSAALTVHALAFDALRRAHGVDYDVDKYKVRNILSDVYTKGITDKKELARLNADIYGATKLISQCRMHGFWTPSDENLQYLVERFGIDSYNGRMDEMVRLYMKDCFLSRKHNLRYGVDFDDMLAQVIAEGLKVRGADACMVDEAQDLSWARQQLALQVSDQFIIVGDTDQMIYSFAGSDHNSIENMVSSLDDPLRLPLTINWRCGANHIALVQKIVPQIQARPNAPNGIIQETTIDEFRQQVKPGHMVLSRKNATMIPEVYYFLKQGIPATIVGQDFGKDITNIINRIAGGSDVSLRQFFPALDKYAATQLDILSNRRNKDALIQIFNDKIKTIEALCEGFMTTGEVINRIKTLYVEDDADNPKTLRFSTIHRGKGAENPNVHILEASTLGTSTSKREDLQQEERNLLYVASTRVESRAEGHGSLSYVGGMPALLR